MTDMKDIELLARIELLAKGYAVAHERLTDHVRALEAEIKAARRRGLPRLRRLVEAAAAERQSLKTAIEANPALFEKPRTRLMHGLRVGIAKGKGALRWADPDTVVRLIRRHLPDRAEALIKVSETPLKGALARLSAAELKKIGVTVEDDGDQVVIKPQDGEIEKLVEGLLALAEEDEGGD